MASNLDGLPTSCFEVRVAKESFKFNAGHFVAYPGFRERLHGHNYSLSIRMIGSHKIGQDGYLLDFGNIKAVAKKVCKEINEYFICPMLSPVLKITELTDDSGIQSVQLVCEDGSKFLFPKADCAMLPIAHSTVEELAIYFWGKILNELDTEYLLKRAIHTLEVTCSEAKGQEAVFRMKIPENLSKDELKEYCNVKNFIDSCIPISGCAAQRGQKSQKDCSSGTCSKA